MNDGLVGEIRKRIAREIPAGADPETLRRRAREIVEQHLRQAGVAGAGNGEDREQAIRELLDEALGFGPIEPFLKDPSVTEILWQGTGPIYIERAGRLLKTEERYRDLAEVRSVMERMAAAVGRRIDEASPICDARLPAGWRVNLTLPAVAPDGPVVCIRKPAGGVWTMERLVKEGSLPEAAAAFLAACVRGRLNLLISGGTSSGKTTLLSALAGCIPPHERILTIEDVAEIRLAQPHVVRLEARPPNAEGAGEISIRRLVANALRMRPDRLVVGECRGPEALDMLQAMNTGHDGSLTTLHANSPRDALRRLETLVLLAGADLPLRAVREQIASAIHLVVQTLREAGGRRRVAAIVEITGLEGETITAQTIWGWRTGGLKPTGLRPLVLSRLAQQGIAEDPSWFS